MLKAGSIFVGPAFFRFEQVGEEHVFLTIVKKVERKE
jgi:hypothetical protein